MPTLSTSIAVGPCTARLTVTDELRRVRTTWTGSGGRPVGRRPARTLDHPRDLEHLESERRRLQAHLADLRSRLELAMTEGRSWSMAQWSERMFADPLRAAMARRLIWQVEEPNGLALAGNDGLRGVGGRPVRVSQRSSISIWHPADSPAEDRLRWRERLADLGLQQPIDQADREVVAVDPESPTVDVGAGTPVAQRAFRGFLTNRGWRVPYLGSWFAVPEGTRELFRGGLTAVLDLAIGDGDDDTVIVGELGFRSTLDEELDARLLSPPLVSDAARDVLGALAAGKRRESVSQP